MGEKKGGKNHGVAIGFFLALRISLKEGGNGQR